MRFLAVDGLMPRPRAIKDVAFHVKPVDWSLLRQDGYLVLLTAEEVAAGLEMKMADFRDSHALFYPPLGAWLGMSTAGVELGSGDPQMVAGVWYVRRDEALCEANRNMEPDVERIVLRRVG